MSIRAEQSPSCGTAAAVRMFPSLGAGWWRWQLPAVSACLHLKHS